MAETGETGALLLGDALLTHNGRVITGGPADLDGLFGAARVVTVPAGISPSCSAAQCSEPNRVKELSNA